MSRVPRHEIADPQVSFSSSFRPQARPRHDRSYAQPFVLAALYAAGVAFGSAIFVAIFAAGGFSFIDIFFYRGLVIIAAGALLHSALLALSLPWMRSRKLSPANLVSVAALSAMLNLTFFTLIPVNLDRSISVFLLAWMGNSANTPLTRGDLQHVFDNVYVGRYHAIDRRIEEQIRSGNIESTPEGFMLTNRGRAFNRFAKAVGAVFSVDPRFLDPRCEKSEKISGLPGCTPPIDPVR